MALNVKEYAKNLAKSAKYASVDVIKEMMPNTTEFVEDNNDLFKSIAGSIRNRRVIFGKVSDRMNQSKLYDTFEETKKSIFEDIKSGKLYNKDPIRQRRIDKKSGFDSMLGGDGFDDFDISFGDDDFNFDDENFGELADAIDDSNRTTTEMLANTIAHTSSTQVNASRTLNQMTLINMQEGFTTINSNLGNIGASITELGNSINSVNQTNAENAKTYYEKSTEFQSTIVAYLKDLSENYKKVNGIDKSSKSSSSDNSPKTFEDVTSYEGMPNLSAYGNFLKKRLTDNLSLITSLNSMGMEGANMSMQFAMSPLAFLPKAVVSKVIGATTMEASKKLDNTLSSVFAEFISSMNDIAENSSFGSIKGMIANFFGMNDSIKSKSSIDTSYDKDNKPWNGKAEKALTEVIPTLISKLISVVSNQNEVTYDYDRGKFVTVKELQNDFNRRQKNEINSAFSDIRSEMNDMMKSINLDFATQQEKKDFEKDYDRFFEYFFKSNNKFNPNKKNFEDYTGLNIDRQNYDIITSLYERLDPSLKMTMNKGILKGRDSWNKYVSNLTKNSPVYSILNNKSDLITTNSYDSKVAPGGTSLLATSYDEKGHNLFWYLRTITETLMNGIITFPNIGNNRDENRVRRNPNGNSPLRPNDSGYRTVETDSSHLPKANSNNMTDEEYASLARSRINENTLTMEYLKYGRNEDTTISGIINNRLDIAHNEELLRQEELHENTLLDDLLESESVPDKIKILLKRSKQAAKAPQNMLTSLINKVDLKIYETLYGKKEYKGKTVHGIVDMMMINVEESFRKFNDFIDDKILTPLKDKLEDLGGFKGILKKFGIDTDAIKEKLFGKDSVLGRTWAKTKEDVKGAWKFTKKSAKDVYDEAKNKASEFMGNFNNTKFGKFMDQVRSKAKKSKLKPDEQQAVNDAASNMDVDPNSITEAVESGAVDRHDKGGVIHKTKIAMVHEGEEIITKEEKKKRDRQKFYENRRQSITDKYTQMMNPNFMGPLKRTDSEMRDFITSINDDNFEDVKKSLGPGFKATAADTLKEEIINLIGHKKGDPTIAETLKDTAKSGFGKAFKVLFGIEDSEDEADNEEKNNTKEKGKKAFKDIMGNLKKYAPSIGSGSLLGFAAGGLIGAPMLGAAVGSAINLVKNSDKLQEYLFGDEEDGVRQGNGKLPKKLVDAMNKYAPDMKKYGITGAITSILPFVPGGPVAGLLLGAGVGFAKNNAKVQDFLFGDTGVLKGLKGKGEKLKKKLPGIGVGAGLLALTGPFGLVGNLVLGAGAGFATQTNKFQEFLFGKDDGKGNMIGGFLPMLRDKVVNPIKDFASGIGDKIKSFVDEEIRKPFHDALSPFIEEFKRQGKRLFSGIKDAFTKSINNTFEKFVGKPLNELIEEKIVDPLTGIFKKIFSIFGNFIGGILKLPTKIMTGAADHLRYKHMKEGDAEYITDEELKRMKERDPAKFFMKTSGQRFLASVQNGGFLSRLLNRRKGEEVIETNEKSTNDDNPEILERKPSDKVSLLDRITNKLNSSKENASNKFNNWKDDMRNKRQNLRTKAFMASQNFVDKLYDQMHTGEQAQKAINDNNSSDESEEDSTNLTQRNRRSVKKATIINGKSKDVEALEAKVKELTGELALMQANRDKESDESTSLNSKDSDNIKDIRNEVYGQLDGIGYNVHTIANILVERFGMPETEAKGAKVSRGNLRRQKWFEKMFGWILNPTRKIKEGFNRLLWGKDKKGGLLGTPMRWINNIVGSVKNIGGLIKFGFGKIMDLGAGVLDAFSIVGGIFKESLSALVPAFGELLGGAVKLITAPIDLLVGLSKGVGELLGGIGEGIGSLAGHMIDLVGMVPSILGAVGDMAIKVGSLAFDIGKTIAKSAWDILKTGVGTLFSAIFGGKGKKSKNVNHKMNGGTLDKVKVLGRIEEPVSIEEEGFKTRHDDLKSFFNDKFDTLYSLINSDYKPISRNTTNDENNVIDPFSMNISQAAGTLKPNNSQGESEGIDPLNLSLPTQYGVVRFDKDTSGEIRPIQDSVFTDYMEDIDNKKAYDTSMFNLINTGDKDDDGKKDKKTSWFSRLANAFGKVLTGGAILKTIGAGLLAGALVDLGKNGKESFTGKFIDKIASAIGPVLKVAFEDVVPLLAQGIVTGATSLIQQIPGILKSALTAEQEQTIATTSDNMNIDTNGNVYDQNGKKVASNNAATGWLFNTYDKTFDSASTALSNWIDKQFGGEGNKMTKSAYIEQQVKNIADYVTETGMSEPEFRKVFLPKIEALYQYRTDASRSILPNHLVGLAFDGQAREWMKNGTDLVEEYKKTGKGKFGRGNSSFFSQNDPRWANMSYNTYGDTSKQTMADSGCGPAVAAMVSNQLSPFNSNPVEAANYALTNGYKEQNGGTRPEFFNSYLAQNGIDSTIDNNVNSSISKKQNVINSLQKGDPVILMGQSNDTVNTPYGSEYPHYVMATGVNGNNIRINDPYSNRPGEVYDLNRTLNSSTISVRTKKSGFGKKNKFGRAGLPTSSSTSTNISNTLSTTTGSLSSGHTALNFITDIGTTFTKALGDFFGIDLSNSANTSSNSIYSGSVEGGVCISNGQNIDGAIAARVIDDFFKNSSKLSGKGSIIVAIAQRACHKSANGQNPGIDPLLLAAIMMQETGGNSNALNTKNNPGGVMNPGGGLKVFNTIEEGIEAVALIIHREWIVKGNNTIAGLGNIYCPVGADNDPNGLNKHWVGGVTKFYNQLVQAVASLGGFTQISGSISGTANSKAQQIVAIARSCIGRIKYIFGSTNLEGGSGDCSSFVQYVYKKAGIKIGRDTQAQYTDPKIVKVSTSYNFQPQPGDIIFFKNTYNSGKKDGVSHVGICTGIGSKFIENNSSKGVCESDFTSNYCKKHFLAICRHQDCVDKNAFVNNNQTVQNKSKVITTTDPLPQVNEIVKNNSAITNYSNVIPVGKGKSNITKPSKSLLGKVDNRYEVYTKGNGKGKSTLVSTFKPSEKSKNIYDVINTHKVSSNAKSNNNQVIFGRGTNDSITSYSSIDNNLQQDNISNNDNIISRIITRSIPNIVNNISSAVNNRESNDNGNSIDQQTIINTQLANSISDLSKTVTNIYNLIAIIVSSGIDIKNLAELLSKLGGTNVNTPIVAPLDIQTDVAKNTDKELVSLIQMLARK